MMKNEFKVNEKNNNSINSVIDRFSKQIITLNNKIDKLEEMVSSLLMSHEELLYILSENSEQNSGSEEQEEQEIIDTLQLSKEIKFGLN